MGERRVLRKEKPPVMQQRIIKTLISIPTFQNVKNEARMKEEERIMMLAKKQTWKTSCWLTTLMFL